MSEHRQELVLVAIGPFQVILGLLLSLDISTGAEPPHNGAMLILDG